MPWMQSLPVQSTDEGPMEMCYSAKNRKELFYIDYILLTGCFSYSADISVTLMNRSSSDQHSSFVFDQSGKMVQTIPTDHPLDCASFTLTGNLSCYVFAENRINSSVYCRPLRSRGRYALFQHLPITTNALMICNITSFIIVSSFIDCKTN